MDNVNVKMEGFVTISNGDKIVFQEKNTITANALSVLAGCLSNINGSNQIDNILAIGSFGSRSFPITTVTHEVGSRSIGFTAEIGSADFVGTIEYIVLNSNTLGQFSTKELGNLYQDEDVILTVNWVINIS